MTDVDRLKSQTDLLALAERDTPLRRVAGTAGGEWHGPCPRCGGRDRFRVQPAGGPDGRGWAACRQCWPRGGDAIAYVMWRESVDFRRACELLGAAPALPRRERPPAPPRLAPGPPPAEWQAAARHVIEETVTSLWSAAGERARAWLHARGLTDETLRRWRIGYCAGSGYRDIAGLSVPCGIVIPCEVGGVIWYLKVRRAAGKPKYLNVKGGRPALFGADTLPGHSIAVFCEGEFDAMLLWQETGDLAGVATLGSADGTPDLAHFGAYLLPLTRLLLAYDADGAGRKGADKLAAMTRRARRVSLPAMPGVKDLTDFHKAGGNLRHWLEFELTRLELTLPAQAPNDVTSRDHDVTGHVTASDGNDVTGHVTVSGGIDVTSAADVTVSASHDVTPARIDVTSAADVTALGGEHVTASNGSDVTSAADVTVSASHDVTPARIDVTSADVTASNGSDVTSAVTALGESDVTELGESPYPPLDPAVLVEHMAALPELPDRSERDYLRFTGIFPVDRLPPACVRVTPLPGGRALATWHEPKRGRP